MVNTMSNIYKDAAKKNISIQTKEFIYISLFSSDQINLPGREFISGEISLSIDLVLIAALIKQ
jgi:hypothetical protein